MDFSGGSDGKESTYSAGHLSSIAESGRFPEDGHLPQYSCLENSTDRGAWQAVVHGVTKSRTQLRD